MHKARRDMDVWGDLERQIIREGDNPPYRYVGERRAGRVDAATLERIIREKIAAEPAVIEGESTVVEDEAGAYLRGLMAKGKEMEGDCATPPDGKKAGPDAMQVREILDGAMRAAILLAQADKGTDDAMGVLLDTTMYRLIKAGVKWD